jgi:hypothetical protein
MTNWKITIEKAENGYICSWEEESEAEEGKMISHNCVFEIPENKTDREGELICMQNLFYFIRDHFGIYSNKYEANLNIKIEPEPKEDETST